MTTPLDEAVTVGSAKPSPRGRHRNRSRVFRAAALIAGLATVLVLATAAVHNSSGKASQAAPARDAQTASGGGPASLSVKTISGSTFSLPAGKPTVLFFMTGECTSCIEGARALDTIERQYGDRLAVLAVDMDPGATTAAVRAFAEAAGSPHYSFARDPDGRMVGAFGVRALDTVVIIDADGAVVYRGVSPDQASLRAALGKAGLV